MSSTTVVEYNGVLLTVEQTYVPAQNGGDTDPSWGEGFEDPIILAGDTCINDILTEQTIEAIALKAQQKYFDDEEDDRADYEYEKSKEEQHYGS